MPLQGRFKPRNPQKYKGDPTNIIYRSQWELKVMMNLDHDPNVIQWSSEEIKIAYTKPTTLGPGVYHPDFYVKYVNGNEYLIEVKPFVQTQKPVPGKNRRRFIREAETYGINIAKWQAAERYCAKRNWTFKILTEKELFRFSSR